MIKIALLGVGSLAGRHGLKAIEDQLPKNSFTLLPVDIKERGTREIGVGEKTLRVQTLEDYLADTSHADLMINFLPKDRTEKWASLLAEKVDYMLDSSGYLSTQADAAILGLDRSGLDDAVISQKRWALPSLASLVMARLVDVLGSVVAVTDIQATALYAASELGKPEMDELFDQTKLSHIHQELPAKQYRKKIAFNLLPVHGGLLSDGQSIEEWMTGVELKKLCPQIGLNMTVIYAPVFIGTSLSLRLNFADEILATQARTALSKAKGVILMDDERFDNFATPIDSAGIADILVSRVREDWTGETALNMVVCADNLTVRSDLVVRMIKTILKTKQ